MGFVFIVTFASFPLLIEKVVGGTGVIEKSWLFGLCVGDEVDVGVSMGVRVGVGVGVCVNVGEGVEVGELVLVGVGSLVGVS